MMKRRYDPFPKLIERVFGKHSPVPLAFYFLFKMIGVFFVSAVFVFISYPYILAFFLIRDFRNMEMGGVGHLFRDDDRRYVFIDNFTFHRFNLKKYYGEGVYYYEPRLENYYYPSGRRLMRGKDITLSLASLENSEYRSPFSNEKPLMQHQEFLETQGIYSSYLAYTISSAFLTSLRFFRFDGRQFTSADSNRNPNFEAQTYPKVVRVYLRYFTDDEIDKERIITPKSSVGSVNWEERWLNHLVGSMVLLNITLLHSFRYYYGFVADKFFYYFQLLFVFLLYIFSLYALLVYDPFIIGSFCVFDNMFLSFPIPFVFDGLSLIFCHFTLLITLLCFANLGDSNLVVRSDGFSFIFILCVLLLLTFTVNNFLIFFILFELLVLPFFYKMLRSTQRLRRFLAVFYLFFYTAFGSLFFLVSVLFYVQTFGSFNFSVLFYESFFDLASVSSTFLFFMIFSLLIKMPCFPFHTWLIEAHVEATTEGSVLLAALILKLSGYGFYRFVFPNFGISLFYLSPYISILAMLGVVYASFSATRQTDLKRILAYSSIVHMNLSFLSFFGINDYCFLGGLLSMAGHTAVAALLFFVAGIISSRGRVKNIHYYKGLFSRSPLLCYFAFIGFAGNISFPGTCNFLGELFMFFGLLSSQQYLFLFSACICSFFCTVYSIYSFVRVFFGNDSMVHFLDVRHMEIYILVVLSFYIIFFGLFPFFLISFFNSNLCFLSDYANSCLSLVDLGLFNNDLSPVSIYFLQVDTWIIIALFIVVLSLSMNSFFGFFSLFFRKFYIFYFFLFIYSSPFSAAFSGGFTFLYVILVVFWVVTNFLRTGNRFSRYEDIYSAILIQFFAFGCLEYSVTNLLISALLLELFGFCTILMFVSLSNNDLESLQVLYEYFVLMCVLGVFLFFGVTVYSYSFLLYVSDLSNIVSISSRSDSFVVVSFYNQSYFDYVVTEGIGLFFIYVSLLGKLYGFPFYFWVGNFYEKLSYPFLGFLNISLYSTYYYCGYVFSITSCHYLLSVSLLFFGLSGLFMGSFLSVVTGGSVRRFLSGGTISMSGFFMLACFSVNSFYDCGSLSILMSFMGVYILSSMAIQSELLTFINKNGQNVDSFKDLEYSTHSFSVNDRFFLIFYLFNYCGYVPCIMFFYKTQIISLLVNFFGFSFVIVLLLFSVLFILFACVRFISLFIANKEYYRSDFPQVSFSNWYVESNNSVVFKRDFYSIDDRTPNNTLINDVFLFIYLFVFVISIVILILPIFFFSFPGI